MDYAGRRQSSNIEDRRNESGMLGAIRDFGRNIYGELTRPPTGIVAKNRYTDAVARRAQDVDGPDTMTNEQFYREAEMQRDLHGPVAEFKRSRDAGNRIRELQGEIKRSRRPEAIPQE